MRARVLSELVPLNSIGAEIGVFKGEFSRAILEIVQPKRLHLIDPWYLFGENWDWAQNDKSTINALIGVLDSFRWELCNRSVELNIGYDFEVLEGIPDNYFDWVYLDTSHRYLDTLKELELLKNKIKDSGVIVGDDWYSGKNELHHGVYQAVHKFYAINQFDLIYANDENRQWAIKKKNE